MKPSIKKLLPFINNRKGGAIHFNVSEKTILRWLQEECLCIVKSNYGIKLNFSKAKEIRRKYKNGSKMLELSQEYEVTFSTISRIVHNVTYRDIKTTANIAVIYNPH